MMCVDFVPGTQMGDGTWDVDGEDEEPSTWWPLPLWGMPLQTPSSRMARGEGAVGASGFLSLSCLS